jgi:hypothetical protein
MNLIKTGTYFAKNKRRATKKSALQTELARLRKNLRSWRRADPERQT